MIDMEELFRIGIIQTTLNNDIAWDGDSDADISMHYYEANRVWDEVIKGFASIKTETEGTMPNIIVLPELTIPLDKKNSLIAIAKKLGCVVVAGLDFIETPVGIKNNAIVIVPNRWPRSGPSYSANEFYFGKRFFSNEEKWYFNGKGKKGVPTPFVHILDAGNYGKIGVAICADFFDIERFVIYKGEIHHLLIIAYNKDVNSFFFIAEAISRLVFCNVIICNTGHYGGSLAFSPYKDSFKRNIFKFEGKDLFNVQIVSAPVRALDEARKIDDEDIIRLKESSFKSRPPGYVVK